MHRSGPRQVTLLVAVVVMLGTVSAAASTAASASPAARRAIAAGPLSVTVTPSSGLVDGQVVSVAYSGVTSPFATECDATALSDTSLGHLQATCAFPGTLGASPANLPLLQTFATAGGGSVHCGNATPCIVLIGPSVLGPFASAPISFTPQPLALLPTTDLYDGETIDAWITAPAASTRRLAQCALPVGANQAASSCAPATSVVLPASGEAHLTPTVAGTILTSGGSTDCTGSTCAFTEFDASGTTVASVPIDIPRAPRLALSPATDVVDGQAMHLTGTHLLPGVPVVIQRCHDTVWPYCEVIPGPPVVAAADGTLDTTVTASQRLTSPTLVLGVPNWGYCRLDSCAISASQVGSDAFIPDVGYTLAAGSLTATPSTGLADGQSVALAGSGIMSTYVGPSFGPFTTGGWAVAECRSDIGSSPTLLAAFQGCGFPGGAGVATIPGSTYSTTVQPTATLTAILGGVTDCRAAPGTCVVGLVRFEQDGTMSTHLAPLTFAP